jgi:hypothetical protein
MYFTIKRFEEQRYFERKIGCGRKCALSSSIARAALKKQTAGRILKSYRELVHRKAKNSAPKTTSRQQSVIKARVKLLTQKFSFAKFIYKYVMAAESYFTVEGNEWQ